MREPQSKETTLLFLGGGSGRDIKLEEATRNLTEANEPLVFPDPQIRKKVRIRWWGRMRRAIPKIEFRKYTMREKRKRQENTVATFTSGLTLTSVTPVILAVTLVDIPAASVWAITCSVQQNGEKIVT